MQRTAHGGHKEAFWALLRLTSQLSALRRSWPLLESEETQDLQWLAALQDREEKASGGTGRHGTAVRIVDEAIDRLLETAHGAGFETQFTGGSRSLLARSPIAAYSLSPNLSDARARRLRFFGISRSCA